MPAWGLIVCRAGADAGTFVHSAPVMHCDTTGQCAAATGALHRRLTPSAPIRLPGRSVVRKVRFRGATWAASCECNSNAPKSAAAASPDVPLLPISLLDLVVLACFVTGRSSPTLQHASANARSAHTCRSHAASDIGLAPCCCAATAGSAATCELTVAAIATAAAAAVTSASGGEPLHTAPLKACPNRLANSWLHPTADVKCVRRSAAGSIVPSTSRKPGSKRLITSYATQGS
jgi:hypothetical protein